MSQVARDAPPPPDPALVAWAASVLAPGAPAGGLRYAGMREGGSPWRIEPADGRADERADGQAAVLREVPAAERAGLVTEVAALQVAGSGGLPVPRVLAVDLDGAVIDGRLVVLTTLLPGTSRLSGPPSEARLRALGALAAAISAVPAPAPSRELPVRERPIGGVDFAALRRAAPARPLLVAAEETLADTRLPDRPPGFVHGDLWQGNTLWNGDRLTGVVDWDSAGIGPAGIDLGSLRCDAWMSAGSEAADAVLAGYEEAAGRPADDVAYWDVVAALCTPPTIGWFTAAIREQGRTDLDQPTLLARRDAFLRDALHRLG